MHILKNTLCFLLLLFPVLVSAQTEPDTLSGRQCTFGKMRGKSGMQKPNEPRQKKDSANTELADDGRFYIIPVVIHVIYDNLANGQPGPENIHDSIIMSQIDVLNEDFGRYGKGFNNNPLSEDSRIRFCLASIDPQGNPTTGIVRIKSPYTKLKSDEEMLTKNLSRWDQKRYLNIWVVRDIDGDPRQQGYAYLPSEVMNDTYLERDGLVVAYRHFGRNTRIAQQNNYLGHTTSHETGHYLELKHTWGDDRPGKGGCGDDDGVFDTPDCENIYYAEYDFISRTCDRPIQCGSPRQVENYMDYSEDRCLNLFTKGQINRMRGALIGYRSGLVTYANAVSTGCKSPYITFNPPTEDELQIHGSISTGTVTLFPNFTKAQNAQLVVYDAFGRLIASQMFNNMKNNAEKLYIPGLKNGLYIFIVQTPEKKYTQKVILFPAQM
ncbi:MAG: zinc-dependent metalloprotease [Bacteroidia bacterium]